MKEIIFFFFQFRMTIVFINKKIEEMFLPFSFKIWINKSMHGLDLKIIVADETAIV